MTPSRTLLDWTIEHNRELAIMRKTTKRWLRSGVIAKPENVKVRWPKKLSQGKPK